MIESTGAPLLADGTGGLVTLVGTALHLPWPKYHPPNRGNGARMHTSVMHPHRPRVMGASLPDTWQWHLGKAVLPFRFSIVTLWTI